MTHSVKQRPSFKEALKVWGQVAFYSFGGPTNQIGVMHRLLVEEKKWISEQQFLHALNYAMLLPGPEAHQLLIYISWLLHRYLGGIVAGSLFILPGFISILFLSILYAKYQNLALVQGLFFGLKPAIIAVIFVALIKIGQKTLTNKFRIAIAFFAFIGIFFLKVPFPLIVVLAGLISFVLGIRYSFLINGDPSESHSIAANPPIPLRHTFKIASIWLALWLGPIVVLFIILGEQNVFVQEAIFFSKMATISFGGAYAVLSYVAQQAVESYHWLSPGEMLDGLGMAEATPGPLIQVVQFVGFMAAYRNPGTLDPLTAGILASFLTAWVIFIPSFLWIFVGAPYIERLRHNKFLNSAFSGVTAAVVGVILNLALWFALHTLFSQMEETHYYFLYLPLPDWASFQYTSFFLASGSLVLLIRYKLGLFSTFALSVLAGMMITLALSYHL